MAEVVIPPLNRMKCPCWRYPDSKGHELRITSRPLDPDDFREVIKHDETFCVTCSCGFCGAWRGSPDAAKEWLYRAMGGETL